MARTASDPVTDFDGRFSEPGASATPWSEAREVLAGAEIFWLTTVRRDGRPHVTPLLALWHDGRLHFTTGPGEQKARNLERNQHCVLTTGSNRFREGLDVVVEGGARQVRETERLQRVADAWAGKYGEDWRFEVRGDALWHVPGHVLLFEVAATRAFAFRRGPYSQTAYRFTA